jgi:hypothetical protein
MKMPGHHQFLQQGRGCAGVLRREGFGVSNSELGLRAQRRGEWCAPQGRRGAAEAQALGPVPPAAASRPAAVSLSTEAEASSPGDTPPEAHPPTASPLSKFKPRRPIGPTRRS